MKLNRALAAVLAILLGLIISGSDCDQDKSDSVQRQRQEVLLQEADAQAGMPNIKNFREKKLLKDILELRDQTGLTTYIYVVNELTGKFIYLGEGIGYGIPYATQYTNPQKTAYDRYESAVIAQADPNGLFSPTSAEGTWILMKDPASGDAKPVYIEPRILVSPFPLPDRLLQK